jgi:hypothetical protein
VSAQPARLQLVELCDQDLRADFELLRQGVVQGASPLAADFVKCDSRPRLGQTSSWGS